MRSSSGVSSTRLDTTQPSLLDRLRLSRREESDLPGAVSVTQWVWGVL